MWKRVYITATSGARKRTCISGVSRVLARNGPCGPCRRRIKSRKSARVLVHAPLTVTKLASSTSDSTMPSGSCRPHAALNRNSISRIASSSALVMLALSPLSRSMLRGAASSRTTASAFWPMRSMRGRFAAPVWLSGYSVPRASVACFPPSPSGARIMRKWLLGTAALLALVGPAISADLRTPVYKAPPPLVPVWSWSGCFVGGHAARLRAKSESWIVRTPGGDFFGQPLGGHSFDSWLGGVQAGCDYQFAGGFVIGLEGDYAWSDAVGSHDSTRETGVAYHQQGQ